jgi:hypothetical protein
MNGVPRQMSVFRAGRGPAVAIASEMLLREFGGTRRAAPGRQMPSTQRYELPRAAILTSSRMAEALWMDGVSA